MIHRAALQHQLLEAIAELPAVQVQNRLMACTDRDVALAMVGLTDEEADSIVSRVSPRKAARVRDEHRLEERRHVDEKHIIYALNVLINSLRGDRPMAGRRSYVRPRRHTGDGHRR